MEPLSQAQIEARIVDEQDSIGSFTAGCRGHSIQQADKERQAFQDFDKADNAQLRRIDHEFDAGRPHLCAAHAGHAQVWSQRQQLGSDSRAVAVAGFLAGHNPDCRLT